MNLEKRGLKNRIPLSNAIKKELYYKLNEISEETGIPKSKLLDKALEEYFEKQGY